MEQGSKKLRQWHSEVFDIFQVMNNNRIIASYVGPFDRQILISLGISLKNTLWDDATQAKKFFKIFVELAHNISLYSVEREEGTGCGTVIINEFPHHLQLSAGNLILPEVKEKLHSKIEIINSSNREQLRALKRKLLSEQHETNGGGNIGLVQIALISRHKLNVRFFPVQMDNQTFYFYIISVRIDKKFRVKR